MVEPWSLDQAWIYIVDITYKIDSKISVDQFIQLLNESGLGKRRPVKNRRCMEGMVEHGNLLVTAWNGARLIGVARSLTDFSYACYLSDLAVSIDYQNQGIGKSLLRLTREQLGPECKLILVSAPQANAYYEKAGFENNPRCWILNPDCQLVD